MGIFQSKDELSGGKIMYHPSPGLRKCSKWGCEYTFRENLDTNYCHIHRCGRLDCFNRVMFRDRCWRHQF